MIEKIVLDIRSHLISFLQTKRTDADAGEHALTCTTSKLQPACLCQLFFVLSNNPQNKVLYADVAQTARKLTIGILRHPHIDFDLEPVLSLYVLQMERFAAKTLGQRINKECEDIDARFWMQLWQDMEEGYYDTFMKHVLMLRIELLQHRTDTNTSYSINSIMQFFDLEYIKKNILLNTYNFRSVFEFVHAFIREKLHPVLKETFTVMCRTFEQKEIGHLAETTNELRVRILEFLIKHALDYLYLEVAF